MRAAMKTFLIFVFALAGWKAVDLIIAAINKWVSIPEPPPEDPIN